MLQQRCLFVAPVPQTPTRDMTCALSRKTVSGQREPFEGLLAKIEATVRDHPMQHMFYGDEDSMRDKPENIRRQFGYGGGPSFSGIVRQGQRPNGRFADSPSVLAPITLYRLYSCRNASFSSFPL